MRERNRTLDIASATVSVELSQTAGDYLLARRVLVVSSASRNVQAFVCLEIKMIVQ